MSKKKSSKKSASVKGMAAETWDKLEQVFESRVARVLNAMQIPTHDDVQELSTRVEALTRAVEKLGGEPATGSSKKRPGRASKKTTRKKAAGKKTASKKTTRKKKTAGRKKKTSSKKTGRKSSKKRTSS